MAREMNLSQTAATRIWRAFGLWPHHQKTVRLSSAPLYVQEVHDIVGLFLERRSGRAWRSHKRTATELALKRRMPLRTPSGLFFYRDGLKPERAAILALSASMNAVTRAGL